MKKIISIFIVCTGLLSTACNDAFLDVAPGDKFSDASFWKTEQHATSALAGVYTSFLEKGSVWATWPTYIWGSSTMTDDAMGTFGGFQTNSISPTDGTVSSLWSYMYSSIRTCNVFLANIDKPEMDEAKRKVYIAEAKFVRAYFYSILWNSWGNVPLVTKPLALNELKQPNETKDKVFEFIVNELNAASSDLPASTTERGRATKGAALALKARLQIYAGKYQDAATTAKAVMDLGQYELFQDATGTGYLNVHQKDNEGSKESIFAIRYQAPDQKFYYASRLYPPGGYTGEGGGLQILQSFIDEFECTDGKTIQASPLFDAADEFKNRDPRLNMAVVKSGDDAYGKGKLYAAALANNYTGYYARKVVDNKKFVDWGEGETDPILIRYAEVLLIYAEGKIESNSIDQSVLDAINSVRARAYGVKLADVTKYPAITTTNQSELRTVLRRERRVELGCEFNDCRLNDIRRWKLGETVLKGKAYGAKNTDGKYRFMFDFNFNSKLYLWPIPQSEIDLIGSDLLKQNPGY